MSALDRDQIFSDAEYWKKRWNVGQIGFHLSECHPMLTKYLDRLTRNRPDCRILVPFCGKLIDMVRLAQQGHQVIGVEYVEDAVLEFFQEQNLEYEVCQCNNFKLYTTKDKRIKIYQGDFLNFTSTYEGHFDCVWDRGAYEAIPFEIRKRYAAHMRTLLAPSYVILLGVHFYDPSLYPGPPHTIGMEEIKTVYGVNSNVEFIDEIVGDPWFAVKNRHLFKAQFYLLTEK